MADGYDVQEIERRWQQRWRDEGTYEIDNDDPRPPFYVLCMYPYPSGPAHQGHVRNYTFGDLIVRAFLTRRHTRSKSWCWRDGQNGSRSCRRPHELLFR